MWSLVRLIREPQYTHSAFVLVRDILFSMLVRCLKKLDPTTVRDGVSKCEVKRAGLVEWEWPLRIIAAFCVLGALCGWRDG